MHVYTIQVLSQYVAPELTAGIERIKPSLVHAYFRGGPITVSLTPFPCNSNLSSHQYLLSAR